MKRCAWARSPTMIQYHDREWGVPVHDDRVLFEFITLEGAQAGLSWETVLNKRDAYRRAFADFVPARLYHWVETLFLDEGFGTLDADTLETVAGTIESLGTSGRMVGIVTHVPALAERVPVRYRVRRTDRGANVTREDA